MDMTMYEELQSKAISSPKDNVNFHCEEQDPLRQQSPIIRGGGVLWR